MWNTLKFAFLFTIFWAICHGEEGGYSDVRPKNPLLLPSERKPGDSASAADTTDTRFAQTAEPSHEHHDEHDHHDHSDDHHHHHHHGEDGKYDPKDDGTGWDIRKSIPGEPGKDYPTYHKVPSTGFICTSKPPGYYADIETRCQVFRVCTTASDTAFTSFLCPNGSLFNQVSQTCDWWQNVDCSATNLYYPNNNIEIPTGNKLAEIVKTMLLYPFKNLPKEISNFLNDNQIQETGIQEYLPQEQVVTPPSTKYTTRKYYTPTVPAPVFTQVPSNRHTPGYLPPVQSGTYLNPKLSEPVYNPPEIGTAKNPTPSAIYVPAKPINPAVDKPTTPRLTYFTSFSTTKQDLKSANPKDCDCHKKTAVLKIIRPHRPNGKGKSEHTSASAGGDIRTKISKGNTGYNYVSPTTIKTPTVFDSRIKSDDETSTYETTTPYTSTYPTTTYKLSNEETTISGDPTKITLFTNNDFDSTTPTQATSYKVVEETDDILTTLPMEQSFSPTPVAVNTRLPFGSLSLGEKDDSSNDKDIDIRDENGKPALSAQDVDTRFAGNAENLEQQLTFLLNSGGSEQQILDYIGKLGSQIAENLTDGETLTFGGPKLDLNNLSNKQITDYEQQLGLVGLTNIPGQQVNINILGDSKTGSSISTTISPDISSTLGYELSTQNIIPTTFGSTVFPDSFTKDVQTQITSQGGKSSSDVGINLGGEREQSISLLNQGVQVAQNGAVKIVGKSVESTTAGGNQDTNFAIIKSINSQVIDGPVLTRPLGINGFSSQFSTGAGLQNQFLSQNVGAGFTSQQAAQNNFALHNGQKFAGAAFTTQQTAQKNLGVQGGQQLQGIQFANQQVGQNNFGPQNGQRLQGIQFASQQAAQNNLGLQNGQRFEATAFGSQQNTQATLGLQNGQRFEQTQPAIEGKFALKAEQHFAPQYFARNQQSLARILNQGKQGSGVNTNSFGQSFSANSGAYLNGQNGENFGQTINTGLYNIAHDLGAQNFDGAQFGNLPTTGQNFNEHLLLGQLAGQNVDIFGSKPVFEFSYGDLSNGQAFQANTGTNGQINQNTNAQNFQKNIQSNVGVQGNQNLGTITSQHSGQNFDQNFQAHGTFNQNFGSQNIQNAAVSDSFSTGQFNSGFNQDFNSHLQKDDTKYKEQIKVEIIPALGYSFDSDTGRKEYISTVLGEFEKQPGFGDADTSFKGVTNVPQSSVLSLPSDSGSGIEQDRKRDAKSLDQKKEAETTKKNEKQR